MKTETEEISFYDVAMLICGVGVYDISMISRDILDQVFEKLKSNVVFKNIV